MASRLIPPDNCEGAVLPIGVGEVIRRIIGKCVMHVAKGDVVEASVSLRSIYVSLQKSGSDAVFEADDMDAVLLEEYVSEKVTNWVSEVTKLADTSMLCCLHLWPEISLDLFFENSARYSKFGRAARERHVESAYPCNCGAHVQGWLYGCEDVYCFDLPFCQSV